jgi:hypothetical protein
MKAIHFSYTLMTLACILLIVCLLRIFGVFEDIIKTDVLIGFIFLIGILFYFVGEYIVSYIAPAYSEPEQRRRRVRISSCTWGAVCVVILLAVLVYTQL